MKEHPHQIRPVAMAVLVAILVVTAGCSGPIESFLGPSAPQNQAINSTDLRSVSLEEDGGKPVAGALNTHDPLSNDAHYEPVTFTAESGTKLNITMQSDRGDPVLRLRSPNGTVVATDSDSGPSHRARLDRIRLNDTGQYTIVASSADNSTFEYNLTVERFPDPLFFGEPTTWNETEQYTAIARGYKNFTNLHSNTSKVQNYSVNPEEDYLTVTYDMNESMTPLQVIDLDSALIAAMANMTEKGQSDTGRFAAINDSWVPDRVYHRAETEDKELYRTTYVTKKWAKLALKNNTNKSWKAYGKKYTRTIRVGPAHVSYERSPLTVTNETFPEVYQNETVS